MTVLNQTPSAFRQLMRADERSGGGERAEAAGGDLRRGGAGAGAVCGPWVKRHGEERPQLVNMYGITETTVHVTYRRLTAEEIEGGARES